MEIATSEGNLRSDGTQFSYDLNRRWETLGADENNKNLSAPLMFTFLINALHAEAQNENGALMAEGGEDEQDFTR